MLVWRFWLHVSPPLSHLKIHYVCAVCFSLCRSTLVTIIQVVIAVTSMPIFQSALISLPLEVESIMELANQESAWLVMKPMSVKRRKHYLFTVLTNHGFELQPKDVPPQLVAYINDIASGAPRYIDLLVKALLDQHRITLQKTGLFNGCQASIRVQAAELLYNDDFGPLLFFARFHQRRLHSAVLREPHAIRADCVLLALLCPKLGASGPTGAASKTATTTRSGLPISRTCSRCATYRRRSWVRPEPGSTSSTTRSEPC